jgi:hypothetical protein
MDERALSTTSPFYTLDAFNGERATAVMLAIEAAMQGNGHLWEELVKNDDLLAKRLRDQGLESPESFSSIQWDNAMLLFTACVELTNDGRPLALGETLTRERFGRFPYGNGSAMAYLLEHIRPNRSITDNDGQALYDRMVDGLEHLSHACQDAYRGHDQYENGFGGMQIHGYLTAEAVHQLRKDFASRAWTASYEEPLDGGVADVAKHLSALLKAAERRRVGLALRTHR